MFSTRCVLFAYFSFVGPYTTTIIITCASVAFSSIIINTTVRKYFSSVPLATTVNRFFGLMWRRSELNLKWWKLSIESWSTVITRDVHLSGVLNWSIICLNLISSLLVSNPRIQADLRFSYQTIRSLVHTWHGDSRLAEVHADSYNSNHEVKWMFDNSLNTHWHPRQHNPTRLVEIDLKVSRSRNFKIAVLIWL